MKKELIFLITLIVITSCAQEDVVKETDDLSIDESTFQLDLKSFENLGKEYNIENGDVSNFLASNFKELLTMENDLELKVYSRKNRKTFAVQSIEKKENNILYARSADPPGFWDSETVCKTCRNESCVKNTLSDAIGEGDTDVDIRVRVKRTLGVQTGLEICYERYVN